MGVLTVFEGVFCIKPLHARTFDVWRTSGILKFKTILPIPYGYVNRTPETPINARNDRL